MNNKMVERRNTGAETIKTTKMEQLRNETAGFERWGKRASRGVHREQRRTTVWSSATFERPHKSRREHKLNRKSKRRWRILTKKASTPSKRIITNRIDDDDDSRWSAELGSTITPPYSHLIELNVGDSSPRLPITSPRTRILPNAPRLLNPRSREWMLSS